MKLSPKGGESLKFINHRGKMRDGKSTRRDSNTQIREGERPFLKIKDSIDTLD